MSNSRTMMWANYRRGPSIAVPGPTDDKSSPYWWYDRISNMAAHWASTGMTDVLFPNPVKTQSGAFKTGDGYGPFDHYDIGSKNQMNSIPTRFGYAEQLRRAVAICRANGMNVLIDHVMHQIMGAGGGKYNYKGADGKTLNGRFPKTPSCFRGDPADGRVPEDPVPSPPDDFSFGDELCPVNALPKNYVWDGLIDNGDWLFRTLGIQGARLDDMKGMAVSFMKAFMTSKAMNGMYFFGEYASGNRNDTEWWVGQVNRLSSAADFDLHYNVIMPMCNDAGSGSYQISWGRGRGMMAIDPLKSVTFVESMDSDTNGFATVVNNKELGYALLLTSEGLPQIYIRDYLREPSCYGLQYGIDNLCWIHANLARGSTVERYADMHVRIYERTGAPGLLVALNNDVWNPQWPVINVQTNFGPNVQIHDYTGHNTLDYWTDGDGRVTIWIPPAANGKGYSCWSVAGLGQAIQVTSLPTTQTFFGADDLDTPAIDSMKPVTVGRIWCAQHSDLIATLRADRTGWQTASAIAWQILDPNSNVVGTGTYDQSTDGAAQSHSKAGDEGWHTLVLTASNLEVRSDYEFTMTYTAPKTFALVPPPVSVAP